MGDLNEQLVLLESELKNCAIVGDHIEMARVFSHYGCILIYLSDRHKLATVHHQILREYQYEYSDPRVRASYARFLALQAVFAGDFAQAGDYYQEARQTYPLTNIYYDEFIMLLEANYWLYFLAGQWRAIFTCLERLKQLNKYLAGKFNQDIVAFENCLRIYQGREGIPLTLGEGEATGTHWFSGFRAQALLEVNQWLNQGQRADKAGEIFNESDEDYGIYPALEKGVFQAFKLMGNRQWQQGEELLNLLAGKADILAHSWYIGVVNLLIGLNIYHGQRGEFTRFFATAGQAFLKLGCNQLAAICEQAETGKWDPLKVKVTNETPLHQFFAFVFSLGQQKVTRHPLSFNLFNQFQIFCYDKQVKIPNWGRKKAEELILFLLVQPGHQAPRDLILEEIFEYEDVQKASNQLYVALHQANKIFRHILEREGVNEVKGKNFVQTVQGKILLNEELIEEVDLPNYRKLFSVGFKLWPTDAQAGLELLQKARMLYSDRYLPEYLFDWLERSRENLQSNQRSILKKLLGYYLPKDAKTEILTLYDELIEIDHLDEYSWQELISFLLKTGRKNQAKQKYYRYTKILQEQLGLEPSAELRKIVNT